MASSSSASPLSQLHFRPDSYGGVIIDPTPTPTAEQEQQSPPPVFPTDPEAFGRALDAALGAWRAEGKRGVWLKLPLPLASHVPVAAARGFIFHHAEPDYVMMTHWLDDHNPSTLPPGPTHQVGVGALVLDASGTRVLAVQEKSGPLQGTGIWKLPTGLLDAGEDLGEGAEREVLEETGVKARFHSLLAFRHAHRFAFGKSDLFFLLRLDVEEAAAEGGPSSSSLLPTPFPCPREIAACEWIGLDELVSQPRFRASPLYSCVYDLCRHHATQRGGVDAAAASAAASASSAGAADGMEEVVSLTPIWGTRLPMGFRPGNALLYHTSEAHHRGRHQAAAAEEKGGR